MPRRQKTKDDFPNFLSGAVTVAPSNSYTTVQIFTPIPRLKVVGNKATVMELLYVDIAMVGQSGTVGGSTAQFQMYIGTPQTALLGWEDPRIFMNMSRTLEGTVGTGGGLSNVDWPFRYQFQTNDGFGYLLASDAFHIAGDCALLGTPRFSFKLFYRFVDIPLAEFIGIVQSTQQS